MQNDLTTRVIRAITTQQMLHSGDRVGVAVSGGADSVALLCLLDDLRVTMGIRLAVLHFNHQLRGAESDREEKFVEELATRRGIEFFAGQEDVAAAARAAGWNLEDAARRLRYRFFRSIVDARHVTRVAVAHTLDDQAETVLARLTRGTGPAGLAAIYPIKGHIIRPLLAFRRAELRVFLRVRGQPWCEDSSNQDMTRLRAQLRHRVLPVFETELQPAFVSHLGRLAQLAREDEAFWTALVAERMKTVVRSDEGGPAQRSDVRLGIRCADLLLPLPSLASDSPAGMDARNAVARRVVRGIIENLRGDCRQLTAQHVQQVLQLATAASSGRRTELPGIVVERSFDWLWFELTGPANRHNGPQLQTPISLDGERASPNSQFSQELQLGSAGEITVVSIPEIACRFRLKVIDWPATERETRFGNCVLDRDLLRSPLVLRNWRPGDSLRPFGRQSVCKLKHLLRAGRVHVRERAGWPVMTSADVVIWARGMPVAAEFAARDTTRTGVLIAEERI